MLRDVLKTDGFAGGYAELKATFSDRVRRLRLKPDATPLELDDALDLVASNHPLLAVPRRRRSAVPVERAPVLMLSRAEATRLLDGLYSVIQRIPAAPAAALVDECERWAREAEGEP